MRSPSERRMSIIETLSERRSDSIDNLAFEFGVSRRTMRNDIPTLYDTGTERRRVCFRWVSPRKEISKQ